jgi:hypothetical protein
VLAILASAASAVVLFNSPSLKSSILKFIALGLSIFAVIGPTISLGVFANECATGTAGPAQILVIISLLLSAVGTIGQLVNLIINRPSPIRNSELQDELLV